MFNTKLPHLQQTPEEEPAFETVEREMARAFGATHPDADTPTPYDPPAEKTPDDDKTKSD